MSFKPFPWRNRREAATTPLSRENLNAAEEAEAAQVEAQAAAEVAAERKAREEAEALLASTSAAGIKVEKERAEAAEALKLAKAANLSDLASVSAARTNLGLGTAAVANVGFGSGEVMAGTARLDQIAVATSGTNLQYSATTTTGQIQSAASGSSGTPDTGLNPLMKFNRTINLSASVTAGDGAEQASVGEDIITGIATNQVQTVGRIVVAANEGEVLGVKGSPDACGLYCVGRIVNKGIGVGIGAFFRGESKSTTGKFSTAQFQAFNERGSNDTANTTGFSSSIGAWLWAAGSFQSAAGVEIGNPEGRQFDVGLHANRQVSGGLTGGVKRAFLLDESHAETSLRIEGEHTVASLAVAAESGPVTIGRVTGVATAGALFEVYKETPASDIAAFVGHGVNAAVSVKLGQVEGVLSRWFVSGGASEFLEGTATGDSGIGFAKEKVFHIGIAGKGSVLRVGEETGVQVRGTHTLASLAVEAGAGPVTIGRINGPLTENVIFEVYKSAPTVPIVVFAGNAATDNVSVKLTQGGGNASWFAAGGANSFITGTAQGDTGFEFTPGKTFHLGANAKTSIFRVSEKAIGLFGVTPVERAAAITSPAAEVGPLKTAVDALREAVKKIGITE